MADHDNRYEDGEDLEQFHDMRKIDFEREQVEAAEAEQLDPHFHDFIPGYPTEMDYLNSLEADDYRDEISDFDE